MKKFPIKMIKVLLKDIYYYGFYSGMDITNGNRDKFFGNQRARQSEEKRILDLSYRNLRHFLKGYEKKGKK